MKRLRRARGDSRDGALAALRRECLALKKKTRKLRGTRATPSKMLVLILHTTLVTLRLQSTLVTLRPCTAPSPLRAGRPSAKGWQKGLPEGFVLDETPPSEQPAPEPAPTGNASYPSSCLDPAVIDLDLMLALNAAELTGKSARCLASFRPHRRRT